jgi:hypothetical protein
MRADVDEADRRMQRDGARFVAHLFAMRYVGRVNSIAPCGSK